EGTSSQLHHPRPHGDPRGGNAGARPGRQLPRHRRRAPRAARHPRGGGAAPPLRRRRHGGDRGGAPERQPGAPGARHLPGERHPQRGDRHPVRLRPRGDDDPGEPRRNGAQRGEWRATDPRGGTALGPRAGRVRRRLTCHPGGWIDLVPRLAPGGREDGDDAHGRLLVGGGRLPRRCGLRAPAPGERQRGPRDLGAGRRQHGHLGDGGGQLAERHPRRELPGGGDQHRGQVQLAGGRPRDLVRQLHHHHGAGGGGGCYHGAGMHARHPGERRAAGGAGRRQRAQHTQPARHHQRAGRHGHFLLLGPAPDQRGRAARGGDRVAAGDADLLPPHQPHGGRAHVRGGRVGGGRPRGVHPAQPGHHQGQLRRQLHGAV
ncbi:MAG: hypothetical protein AVDCRST_MAG68-3695, partial [uncultured Gemmatimonadetes bacterium]